MFEHPFDDGLSGANQIEVLVAKHHFGIHDLHHIENLIDHLYLFAGLLFVPGRKLGQYLFVDVIGPVIYFRIFALDFSLRLQEDMAIVLKINIINRSMVLQFLMSYGDWRGLSGGLPIKGVPEPLKR